MRINETNALDEVTIQTEFNNYRFLVTDPACCRGQLSGGRIGDEAREAYLAGAIMSERNSSNDPAKLEPGDRAVFLLDGENIQRLTTSPITEVIVVEPEPTEPTVDDC